MQGGNTVTVAIPGGCTSFVHPLDVSLNKLFKGHVCAEWLHVFYGEVSDGDGEAARRR